MAEYQFFLSDSLEKVFEDSRPQPLNVSRLTAIHGETISLQLVYTAVNSLTHPIPFRVSVSGIDANFCSVETVPSHLPVFPKRDIHYLKTTPGLYPDLLVPSDGVILPINNQFRSLWISIPTETVVAGSYIITVRVKASDEDVFEQKLQLDVLSAELPTTSFLHTEWFHCDGICQYYSVEPFSEEFWRITENFIKFAGAKAGINMLLTPVFTPSLDIAMGGERLTIQLVGVEKLENDSYIFDFSKLNRWCDICLKYGITNIEIAHLFTQWGAKFTPKIIATVNSVEQEIFGWHVEATSVQYRYFLEAFIPALLKFLTTKGYGKETIFFHISDEPSLEHLSNYQAAKAQVADLLEGYTIMDALSNYDFYKLGAIETPIPANDHIEPFIENKVSDLWVYYCCSQSKDVSNRFFSMPSYRNRIMGTLCYLYDIKGFLHWGFNFYNSQYSIHPINPYIITDAKYGFPSGDPFLVYPGPDGIVYSSIRNEVQMEALYDLRRLKLLEELTDAEFTKAIIKEVAGADIKFNNFPMEKDFILRLCNRINSEIEKRI